MNDKFDGLAKGLAQSVTRCGALNKLSALHAGSPMILLCLLGLAAQAQPIQPEVIYNFPRPTQYPYGNLVQASDGNFYGTTAGGGQSDVGTVFKMATNRAITIVASFNNTNGSQPHAGLTLGPDGNYYGTTWLGGTTGYGTAFRVTTNGELTMLVSFNLTNGMYPEAGLTLGNDGNLYGTTSGNSYYGNYGTVFRLTTAGAMTTLVSFNGANGAQPYGALTLGSDGVFYGTTSSGGNGYGTVFKMTSNGELTTLAYFDGTNGTGPYGALTLGPDGSFYGTANQGLDSSGTIFKVTTNGILTRIAAFNVNGANGSGPLGALTLGNDGNFYGTTGWGGNIGSYGTVFRVTTNGALTRLVAFNGANGVEPHASLTLGNDGNFYGTTLYGGGVGPPGAQGGSIFKMTTAGALTELVGLGPTDGLNPEAALILGRDGSFYGTTAFGGMNDSGTVFKLGTNGGVTTLASFNDVNGLAHLDTALTLGNDGNFYGVTAFGGAGAVGTVFRVTTNGTLTRLVSFSDPTASSPEAPLALGPDGNFYGTTSTGGVNGLGTVFRVTPAGAFTRLYSFNTNSGANPAAALTLGPDGSFYGTTSLGGSGGGGTIYRVTTNGVFATLISFNAANAQRPQGALMLGIDGDFYGLTGFSSFQGSGSQSATCTLFRLTTTGTLTTLGSMSYPNASGGLLPALTLGRDGNFYGTIPGDSSINPGTVFQVTTNGTFATLVSFATTNGAVPLAPLTVGSDGNLYGTTAGGGSGWEGTIFRVSLQAPVIIGQPRPASQVVPAGVDVTLSASVFGAVPMSSTWFFNGASLPGETNTLLTLKEVVPSTSGNYSLRVTNGLGTASSSNAVLTVLPALVTNLPVSPITATGAVLNGSVTLGSNETLAWFEWGTDTNYGQIDGVTDLPGGSGTVTFSAALSGLDENTVYHFRIVAWNSFGIVYGVDQTFRVGAIYAYAASVLADQPLVYYRFDESNGTVAINAGLLGEGANATYNASVSLGNPSLVPAFGYAARFNNTNSGVAVPALGSYSQITIEAWLKPRSFPGYNVFDSIYTADNWAPGALHTHVVDVVSFHQYEFSINGNNPQWIDSGYPGLFVTNGWVHLAATYDSAVRQTITYVNGHPLATNTFTTAVPVNLTAAHIGEFTGTGNWFDGEIDEFAIYGAVLPQSRIQAHYQAAIGTPVLLSAQTTNKLTLSWVGPGFWLERNSDLLSSATWSPVVGGSNSPVSLAITNPSGEFFRLRWP